MHERDGFQERNGLNNFSFFLLVLRATFLSTGGLANVPALHSDLIGRGWATEGDFAQAIAIGQVSPGPNGLWVISLGYLLSGPVGAACACLGLILPPFFVLVIDHAYQRVSHSKAVQGFVRGLTLGVTGVFVAVLYRIVMAEGFTVASDVILLMAAGLAATRRVPVWSIVLMGAVVGVAFLR